MEIEDIKTISTIAKPLIDQLVKTLIKPHISRLNNWVSKQDKKYKVEDNFWESKFTKYLETIYKDSIFVTTLVFPNSQTKLKELYVPLTIIQANSYDKFRVDEFDYSIFNKYDKIIISDYAGMGKSTLLKRITVSMIEQKNSIPILVELRKIDSKNSIIDEILNQINPIDNSFDKDLIYELLKLGFFTILLDGFDEIPYDTQDKITAQLSEFIKKAGDNNFIITSRPESALSTFSNFQLFYIQPLKNHEAYLLIEKLDDLSKVKFGDKLIAEVKEKNTQVKEFLTNPFLVSLLYKSYTYNKDIPSKKITFYEEVYSCLFKHHDLSKEGFKRPKRSRLDIFDFEIILRDIAFETSKIGKVIYTKDEMVNHITYARSKNTRFNFKEQSFFEDLTTTVPIFAKEGVKIKWAHKSIQDFFAAKYISNHSRKEEIITAIFKSEKYHYLNIIDLLYELEYKLFRKIIIRNILQDFVSYYETQFQTNSKIPQKLIDERIALVFASRFCVLKTEDEIGFNKARESFAKEINVTVEDLKIGATFHRSATCYYTMNELTLKKEILKILRLKNEDIFIKDITKRHTMSNEQLEKFDFNVPYLIDDNLTKPYNSPELFENINGELKDRLKEVREKKQLSYNLDYNKCKNELEAIDKELKIESNEDLLSNI